MEQVGDLFEFVQPLMRDKSEREPLLVPCNYSHQVIADSYYQQTSDDSDDVLLTMPNYQPQDNDFLSLVHVALKIRNDVVSSPGHKGFEVSEEAAIACVPDSLYMFLNLMLGGQRLLSQDNECHKESHQSRVLSIAQDVVYAVSNGTKWMPKHIGLGSTLHQATRSRKLVELFNKAGHILSYQQILTLDTSLAQNTLDTMNKENGAVIPPNLKRDSFIHFTADNIDINDSSLDGKNTFHATQVAAWQRGPEETTGLSDLRPINKTSLVIPEAMQELQETHFVEGKSAPQFAEPVKQEWYVVQEDETDVAKVTRAIDMSFIVQRQTKEIRESWSSFNHALSKAKNDITTVGYMPIIQAPAHDLDTLNTVVRRCMYISSQLGQQYTVLTVDQALYFKLMDLKWNVPEYKDKLIPRLGGLHISMNYLKVIGQHMKDSGLVDAWVDSGILGAGTADHVMTGKAYNKGMRSHKLTFQALWRLLLPPLMEYVKAKDESLLGEISDMSGEENAEELAGLLKTARLVIVIQVVY